MTAPTQVDALDAAVPAVRQLLTAHLTEDSIAAVRDGRLPVAAAVDAVLTVLGRHSISGCIDCQAVAALEAAPEVAGG